MYVLSNLSTKYARFFFKAGLLHIAGHALGFWICGCCLFYKRELWTSKSAGAQSTKSLKICRCKRWCPKDLRVCAHAAPMLMHSLTLHIRFMYVSVNIIWLVYINWESLHRLVSKMTTTQTTLSTIIKYTVSFIIAFSCVFFVTYQSYNCVWKFLGYPQGTRLSIEFIGNTSSFPAITICSHPNYENKYGFKYNETFLSDCGIKR